MNKQPKQNDMAVETAAHRDDTAMEITAAHQKAVQSGAVERYLLNQLLPSERLHFEEHYFTCPVCAEEVASGQDFIEGVRTLHSLNKPRIQEPHAPWWKRTFMAPVLMPATLVLLLANVQNIISIRALKSQITASNTSIRALNSELADLSLPQAATLITAQEHEEVQRSPSSAISTQFVTLRFPPLDGPTYPFYRVDVLKNGKLSFSKVLPSPGSENSLALTFDKKVIGPGYFEATVFGLDQATQSKADASVRRYNFGIQ